MDIFSDDEIDTLVKSSKLVAKYNQEMDSESAYEILNAKMLEASKRNESIETEAPENRRTAKAEKSTLEQILASPVTKQIGRTAAQVITRSLLGALGLGGKTSSKSKGWF
jgi:hypothetical protein